MIILTKPQAEAIVHRLEVPEAIWDIYSETYPVKADTTNTWAEATDGVPFWFSTLCDDLIIKVSNLKLVNISRPEMRVLIECIEGSTLVGIAIEESDFGRKPPQYVTQTRDVLRRLADKFAGFQDETIQVPAC